MERVFITLRSDHTRLLTCLFLWCLMMAKDIPENLERTLAAASAAPRHPLLPAPSSDGVAGQSPRSAATGAFPPRARG